MTEPTASGPTTARPRTWLTTSPRRMDLLSAGALLALAAVTSTAPGVDLSATELAVAVAGSVIQSAALLFRRRAPLVVLGVSVAVLVVTAVVTGDPVASELGVAFAVYAVATQRPPAVTWATWAGALGAAFLTYLATLRPPVGAEPPGSFELLLTTMLGLVLVTVVALALGLTVRSHREQVAALEERARQLALEQEQREQLAAAAERTRMAREMHDVVAHSVAVMVALAHGAAASFDNRPDRAREALDELSTTGRAALADMRRIVGLLRDEQLAPSGADAPGTAPDHPSDLSSADTLPALVETFNKAGLPVVLVERGPALPRDPHLRHAVFRVVQECLTNVLRHAPDSSSVQVRLDREPDHVRIVVLNARGRDETEPTGAGYGLAGIRERAAAFRGTVTTGPTSAGWQVTTTLHYEEES
ncbi:MAG TPA: sensor histidine kinase [Arachnia sp.]|nr:sensor histidine kinase [Arachnia sp.]